MLSGDLLNQLMASSYMAREIGAPYLGMYGACSTLTQSMLVGAVMTDGGYVENAAAGTSSHFATAERQFRMPLEHGNQRTPQAQWTATAAGAVINDKPVTEAYIAKQPDKIKIVGDVMNAEAYAIAVQKGNSELLDKINAGMKDLQDSGKFDEIHDKWFS